MGLTLAGEAIQKFLLKEFAVGLEQALLAGIELGGNVGVELKELPVIAKQSFPSAVKDLRFEGIKVRCDFLFLSGGEMEGVTQGNQDFVTDGFSGDSWSHWGRCDGGEASEAKPASQNGEEGGSDEERVFERVGHGFVGVGRSS